MKTLVSEACELVPPASGRFVPTLLCGWVKMRCNKLESIQSCEFWQELNKTEGWDRCGKREPRTRRAGCHCPQPITCCWTRRLSAICHPVHTGREVQSATHTHIKTSVCQWQPVCTAYFCFKAHTVQRACTCIAPP